MSTMTRSAVSEAEFLAMPESTDRLELIDGEVIVSPAPSFWHQELLKRVVFALEAWRRARPEAFTVGQAPLDIRFAPGRILQPDAFVLRGAVPRDQTAPLDRAPVLCIEILSTHRAYDRETKRRIYGAAGVEELWLVAPGGSIERWTGEGLTRVESVVDRLESPLLPGFSLGVETLFAD